MTLVIRIDPPQADAPAVAVRCGSGELVDELTAPARAVRTALGSRAVRLARDPPTVTDHQIDKWRGWIGGPIRSSVLTMHLQRDAWRKVSVTLERNPGLPDSYWWEFMVDTYATTQAVAVRRQADLRFDVVSLARLIAEIRDDHTRLTKDWWIGLWGEPSHPIERVDAEHQWIEFFGREVGDHLDPAIPTEDAETLKSAAADVRRFVNKHLAHADEAEAAAPTRLLQLSDVHEVIDTIGDLFRRYSSLLTASSYACLVPVIQHDWMAAFQVPWMRSDDAP